METTIVPDLKEYLPKDILDKRLEFIKGKEGANSPNYKNLFGRCNECDISLWVGRENTVIKNPFSDDFYIFDDYDRVRIGDSTWPICHTCKEKCGCTDSDNRKYIIICVMCEKSKCRKHTKMYANSNICDDCYTHFMLGKEIIKILREKRPTSFEELYSYTDLDL